MGRAVVHFEIEGLDAAKLREFYKGLFDWDTHVVDPDNPAAYGMISRDENVDGAGNGLGGAIAQVPDVPSTTWKGRTRAEGHQGGVTVFVEVPDVEAALLRAEQLGGTRMLGPDPLFPGVEIGRFADPEGHLIGVITERGSAS
jgi:predicted enzyme related to lactoylglutathione lyase